MNCNEKQVPSVVIKRLPRYYRYLGELLKMDIKRISSGALSERMEVTASQIRQDFNYFGGFGQQGYGYNVEYLYNAIGEILGLDKMNDTIVIGAGNLGKALANHTDFEKRGFRISALFDLNPDIIGTEVDGKPILSMSELEDYIKDNNISIAILTVPKAETQKVADILTDFGIKGLLNFSYTELKADNDVVVENVHLSDSLMTLSYNIKERNDVK